MKKIAFVTGASSGIGKAIAESLAKEGYKLIISGRRKENIDALKNSLEKQTEVWSLCFDVRDRKETEKTLEQLPQEWKNIDVLINNAGLAVGLDPLQNGDIDDWERMIDTNVKGLLYVSRIVSSWMCSKNTDKLKGHIVNIGSIAGKEVYPNGNVYCGSKHAVDAISKGMRMDLLPHRIKVSQICPGAVETEFSLVRFKGDDQRASQVYNGFKPLTAEDVAQSILFCISLPEHVNINDLVIMPTAQASSSVFHKQIS